MNLFMYVKFKTFCQLIRNVKTKIGLFEIDRKDSFT